MKHYLELSTVPPGAGTKLPAAFTPLVSKGVEVTPAANSQFAANGPLYFYFEVYEPPQASSEPVKVQVQMRIIDAKTGRAVKNSSRSTRLLTRSPAILSFPLVEGSTSTACPKAPTCLRRKRPIRLVAAPLGGPLTSASNEQNTSWWEYRYCLPSFRSNRKNVVRRYHDLPAFNLFSKQVLRGRSNENPLRSTTEGTISPVERIRFSLFVGPSERDFPPVNRRNRSRPDIA